VLSICCLKAVAVPGNDDGTFMAAGMLRRACGGHVAFVATVDTSGGPFLGVMEGTRVLQIV